MRRLPALVVAFAALAAAGGAAGSVAHLTLTPAIVSPKCYLCFQALEANRPIAAGAKLPCD